MRIAIVRKLNKKIEHYKKDLVRLGMKYTTKNPDFVVSIGGDGTLLEAERRYPGIPKIAVRESNVCVLCQEGDLATMLEKLQKKKYTSMRYPKLITTVNGKKLLATNDFIIRNKKIQEALRFIIKVNNKLVVAGVVIGDGVVVATSFGSTGYYNSITYQPFEKGFGVAFNNPTRKMKPLVLKEKDVVSFTLHRGQGLLAVDNDKKIYPLKLDDTIEFRLTKETTNIVKFN